jgi:hypothetical protein
LIIDYWSAVFESEEHDINDRLLATNWYDGEESVAQPVQNNSVSVEQPTDSTCLLIRDARDDANKFCNLLSSSRNGAFTNGGARTHEFCITLGQQAATTACYWLVQKYMSHMGGCCS